MIRVEEDLEGMNSKLYNLIEKYPNNIEKIYNSKVFDEIKLYNRENRLLYSQKGTPNKNLKEVLDMECKKKMEQGRIPGI